MEVRVQYPLNKEVWNKVVVNATEEEDPVVEDEGSTHFIIVYPSETHFNNALVRFDGEIEYKRI